MISPMNWLYYEMFLLMLRWMRGRRRRSCGEQEAAEEASRAPEQRRRQRPSSIMWLPRSGMSQRWTRRSHDDGLRYALLGGLSVPQRADGAAAPEGGIPAAQAGGLHQPLQERHAGTLRLRQRHRVLQQRRRVAGVRWAPRARPVS